MCVVWQRGGGWAMHCGIEQKPTIDNPKSTNVSFALFCVGLQFSGQRSASLNLRLSWHKHTFPGTNTPASGLLPGTQGTPSQPPLTSPGCHTRKPPCAPAPGAFLTGWQDTGSPSNESAGDTVGYRLSRGRDTGSPRDESAGDTGEWVDAARGPTEAVVLRKGGAED